MNNQINEKLLHYILRFPFPYLDVLREQVLACQITNEWYSDCYIIHFHQKKNVKPLPLWLPIVPQGFQILKENGPLLCQLYIEHGYIVQLEVIDMGMNEIDWEYLWSHKPLFDIEYDFSAICRYLTDKKPRISQIHISQQHVYLKMCATAESHTIGLWNCNILSSNLLCNLSNSCVDICALEKDHYRYLIKIDDNPVIECSLVCLQDRLAID